MTCPEEIVRCLAAKHEIMLSRVRDYLLIGGEDRLYANGPRIMSARVAADRVGVTERTIQRYRRMLRDK